MTRPIPHQMARWLSRRERHGWSWSELDARSGHAVWKLRYCQRRLEAAPAPRPGRGCAFVTVDIAEPEPTRTSSATALEITTPSGYRVTVACDFDPGHLQRVVQALERGAGSNFWCGTATGSGSCTSGSSSGRFRSLCRARAHGSS